MLKDSVPTHMRLALLLGASSLVAVSTQATAATPPVAGTYIFTPVTTSVSGCPPQVQTGVGTATLFSYPGAGANGATERTYTTASSATALTILSFSTKTPASGASSWSFKGNASNYPSGFVWSFTGNMKFTFVDAHSFLVTETTVNNQSSIGFPNCQVSSWASFVYTGS